jgi:methionyl aminopeptidase
MITIKSRKEFEKMAVAGQTVAVVLSTVKQAAVPGVSLQELDLIAAEVIRSRGCTPSFLGYHGYPASICTSPNNVIVHGIPSDYRLVEGDVLSVDAGAIFEGFHGDAAITFPIGEVSAETQLLIDTTERALVAGIAQVRAGARLGDIGHAVETEARRRGFGVVREYVGHGIGRQMHEDPQVPNYGKPGTGTKLRKGMAICIEPMFNMGGHETLVEPDGWTVVTADASLSAHFEHTIAITDRGPRVMTLLSASEDDLAVAPTSG